ncbi:MAG: hypothetical protein DMF90_06720, partial [Acidobacteria bacterium]
MPTRIVGSPGPLDGHRVHLTVGAADGLLTIGQAYDLPEVEGRAVGERSRTRRIAVHEDGAGQAAQ